MPAPGGREGSADGKVLLESRHGEARPAPSRQPELRDPPARRAPGAGTSRGFRTRCGSCSRTSSATAPRRRSRPSRGWVATRRAVARDLLHARRASCSRTSPACRRRRPRRDARRDARAGRRPGEDQPAHPGRARHRPLGAGRRVRVAARDRAQRRARVRAEPRALRLPALGPERVRQLQRRAAEHGHLSTRSTSSTSRASSRSRDGVAFPDTLVGTDSHTTMVNGLGVLGWGVGGIEAEAAMLGEALSMLVPQVVGFRLTGALPRGRDRDRPRAHRDARSCARRRRREVRRVLRARRRLARARRPRDAREHEPRVRRDVRLLPRRRRDARRTCASPAATPSASRSSRRTARRTCSGTSRTSIRSTRRSSSSTSATSSRRSPGRAARRTACRSRARRRRSSSRSAASASTTRTGRTTRRSPTRSRRATRRPATAAADAGAGARRTRRPLAKSAGHGRGRGLRARARLRRDRRDHVVHEHVEPVGDDRRRPAREEGGRARPERKPWVKSSLAPGSKVVTEYYRARRPRHVPRRARLQHSSATAARRASATPARCPTRSAPPSTRGRPRRLRRPLRQPQLRGAHPRRGEGELPRVAAARRRVRARRPDGHRPRSTSRSARAPTARTSSCATSGRAATRSTR